MIFQYHLVRLTPSASVKRERCITFGLFTNCRLACTALVSLGTGCQNADAGGISLDVDAQLCWLATCLSGAAAHWSVQTLFDKSSFNHPSVVESPLIGCHICNVMSQASTLSLWTEQNTVSHSQSNCLYPCLIPFNSFIHDGVWARIFKLLRRPRIDSKEPPIPLQAV